MLQTEARKAGNHDLFRPAIDQRVERMGILIAERGLDACLCDPEMQWLDLFALLFSVGVGNTTSAAWTQFGLEKQSLVHRKSFKNWVHEGQWPDKKNMPGLCDAFWPKLGKPDEKQVMAIASQPMPIGDPAVRQRAAFCIAWRREKHEVRPAQQWPAPPHVNPIGDSTESGFGFKLKLPADVPDRVRAVGQALTAKFNELRNSDDQLDAPFANWPDHELLTKTPPDVVTLIIRFTQAINAALQPGGAWNRGGLERRHGRQQFCEYTLKLLFVMAVTPAAWKELPGQQARRFAAEKVELYHAARSAASGLDFVLPRSPRTESPWLHQIDKVHAGSAAARQAHIEAVLAMAFLPNGPMPPKRRPNEADSQFEGRRAAFRRELGDVILVKAITFGRTYGLAEQFEDAADAGVTELIELANQMCPDPAAILPLPFVASPGDYLHQRETLLHPAIQTCLATIHRIP